MSELDRLSRLLDYLAQDPRNTQLLGDVADAQLQLGDWAAAKFTLRQLLDLVPGDGLARYRLAVAERASGDAAAALALLTELIAEGHASAVVMQELARSQAQQGDWASVCPTLAGLDANTLPSDQGDAVRQLRIRAHHHLRAMDDALAEIRAWQVERGAAIPLHGQAAIATLLLDAERIDEAGQVLASLDTQVIDHHAELGAAAGFIELSQGHAAGALERFARSAQIQPEFSRAHLGQGLALASLGDLPRAIQALKLAVSLTPSHLGSWHALAWMQLLSGDIDSAAGSFEGALMQDDTFGETHGGLALVAALRNDREASEQHLRIAAKLDVDSMNVMVASTLLERGPGALDAELLSRALGRFMGLASRRNPALKEMIERMLASNS